MELQCGSADFPFFGVRFIAVTDGYDSLISGTAEDGLVVPLKNLINEAYAKDISKKICSTFDGLFEKGSIWLQRRHMGTGRTWRTATAFWWMKM